ncbi:MAG: hypothetical protein HQK54_10220 [Oligoflexales bacterium]|nr:hypothetical protein [Oligoflexales bacterium]
MKCTGKLLLANVSCLFYMVMYSGHILALDNAAYGEPSEVVGPVDTSGMDVTTVDSPKEEAAAAAPKKNGKKAKSSLDSDQAAGQTQTLGSAEAEPSASDVALMDDPSLTSDIPAVQGNDSSQEPVKAKGKKAVKKARRAHLKAKKLKETKEAAPTEAKEEPKKEKSALKTVSDSTAKSAPQTASAETAEKKEPAQAQPLVDEASKVSAESAKAQEQAAAGDKNTAASQTLISDGSQISIEEIGFKITPPQGWSVTRNITGLSLFMEEPAPLAQQKPAEEPKKEELNGQKSSEADQAVSLAPLFKRNITVATMNNPFPIDDKETGLLKSKLVDKFSKITGIKNFQIVEPSKYFDYKGKNDGLIIYSSFELNDIPMSQMHVILSGANNSFLLTYTDISKEFYENKDAYNKVWASMTSAEITGTAPNRYMKLIAWAPVGVALLVVTALFMFIRKRRERSFYEGIETMNEDREVSSISQLKTDFNAVFTTDINSGFESRIPSRIESGLISNVSSITSNVAKIKADNRKAKHKLPALPKMPGKKTGHELEADSLVPETKIKLPPVPGKKHKEEDSLSNEDVAINSSFSSF